MKIFNSSIFDRQNNGRVLIILLGVSVTLMLSAASDKIISSSFPHRLVVDDIIFRLFATPRSLIFEYYTDVVLISMIAITVWAWKDDMKQYFPYLAVNACLFYSTRAIINVLTPLQRPLGDAISHGLLRDIAIQYGMFPSGHVGFAVLLFLLTKDRIEMNLRNILFVLIAFQALLMVITRGHYSIDVVGGILLAYFVYKILQPYKERLVFYSK
ncbi:MAG: phosphatase PAP2-related protein [Candidatus Dojkabacteria bacterium]|nr:MAG: phosphatase PAP2-related protein [Candidatus Dojkabacteria bacterium]